MSQPAYKTYRDSSSDAATTSDDTTTSTTTCPECNSQTTTDNGERVCTECGLVLDDTQLDRGPEWRAFTSSERSEKSRVGAPTTNMMHDKGLSTTIDWQNKDGYGNALSGKKRRKMQRLRTWNKRFKTTDSKERNLKLALGEIDRMASALGLPSSTREMASVIFRRAHDENLVPGRSIEGVASAALYAAARREEIPRSLDELSGVSRVEKRDIQRTYSYIAEELGLAVPNATGQQYLPRFVSELDASDEMQQQAKALLDTYYETGAASGKTATGLAAASLYAASCLQGKNYTQQDIADVADVTKVTIRNRYTDMLEVYAEETDEDLALA